MITIHNKVRKIVVDETAIQKNIQKILDHLEYHDFDLGVMLTTNATIRRYNADYRNKDKATDVLSFPFHYIAAGDRIVANNDEEKNLGDIIVSLEFVQHAAQKLGTTFEKRLNRIFIHSICHLLGYDHIEDDEFKVMIAKEKSIAQVISLDCSWE